MKVNWKKAALGLVSGSALLALAACGGNGGSTDGSNADAGSGSDEKTITVSVGADYIDYINEVKSDFESENDVTINVVEMDMFDQMDALQLDGPAGKGPDRSPLHDGLSHNSNVQQLPSEASLFEAYTGELRHTQTTRGVTSAQHTAEAITSPNSRSVRH